MSNGLTVGHPSESYSTVSFFGWNELAVLSSVCLRHGKVIEVGAMEITVMYSYGIYCDPAELA